MNKVKLSLEITMDRSKYDTDEWNEIFRSFEKIHDLERGRGKHDECTHKIEWLDVPNPSLVNVNVRNDDDNEVLESIRKYTEQKAAEDDKLMF